MKSFVFPNMLDVEKFNTIEDAMVIEIIPKDYHEIFNKYKKCSCGSPIIINDNRTVMKCSNPHCTIKIANRYSEICKKFVTGIGPETAKNYVNGYCIHNLSDAVQKSPDSIKEYIMQWLKEPHYMSDIIKFLCIPNIGVVSEDIFTTLDEFYELDENMIKSGLIEFFSFIKLFNCSEKFIDTVSNLLKKDSRTASLLITKINALGVTFNCDNDTDFINGIKTLGIFRYLRCRLGGFRQPANLAINLADYWDEIKYFVSIANVKNTIVEIMPIVITGDVILARKEDGSYYGSKEAYVAALNEITEKLGFKFKLGSAIVSSKFIVADTDAPTRKYLAGKNMNKLIRSDDLYNALSSISKDEDSKRV